MIRFLTADLRHALRRARLRPGFTITSVATLALGIGATTAIFSVVDAVVLRPLPWPDADRLVSIHAVEPERLQRPAQAASWNRATLGWREWKALETTDAFADVAAWMPNRFLYTNEAGPELVDGMYASANLLRTLGVQPAVGRMFAPEEDRAETDGALISYEAWQRRFGGESEIVGRTVLVGLSTSDRGRPRTIVGVLPAGLRFQGQTPEFVLPIGIMAYVLSFDTNRLLRLVGRVRPGMSLEAANGATSSIVSATEISPARTGRVASLREDEIGRAGRPLGLLFGGALLLLLVACSNVAGLLLGEARARRHEIAVRTSLGGSFSRILAQLAAEQLVLAMAAAGAGILLAEWLTPILVSLAPPGLRGLDSVAIDFRIAGFAFVVGVITTMVFSIGPAAALARTPAALVLAEGGRGGASRRHIAQRLVVSAEIAISLVLVVGAALFGETIARLTSRPLGFDSDQLVVVSASAAAAPFTAEEWQQVVNRRNDPNLSGGYRPPRFSIEEIERLRAGRDQARTDAVVGRLRALPGVTAVAATSAAPFVTSPPDVRVAPSGDSSGPAWLASRFMVTDKFFDVMGLKIVRGRGFDETDVSGARRVVVSRELERQAFDGHAVGRLLVLGDGANATRPYEIVGVAENIRQREYAEDDRPVVYVLDRAGRSIGSTTVGQYLLRTAADPAPLLPLVRDAVRQGDPPMAVTSVRTMDSLVRSSVAEPRLRATLAVIFGTAALVLAAVGLHGLAMRRVEERRREISVRVALGARPGDVRRLVLHDAFWTLTIGLGVGLPAALATAAATRSLLFGVSSTSPHVFLASCSVVAMATMAATLLPARRAASLDPMSALKE